MVLYLLRLIVWLTTVRRDMSISLIFEQLAYMHTIFMLLGRTYRSLLERYEYDCAIKFLWGIHNRFSNLRSQILLMESLPSIFRIFNVVQREEYITTKYQCYCCTLMLSMSLVIPLHLLALRTTTKNIHDPAAINVPMFNRNETVYMVFPLHPTTVPLSLLLLKLLYLNQIKSQNLSFLLETNMLNSFIFSTPLWGYAFGATS